jgi:hypothetical protein
MPDSGGFCTWAFSEEHSTIKIKDFSGSRPSSLPLMALAGLIWMNRPTIVKFGPLQGGILEGSTVCRQDLAIAFFRH